VRLGEIWLESQSALVMRHGFGEFALGVEAVA